MNQKTDLTQGNITKQIVMLSLPIIATSFIQMAYGMIDTIWIGKAGSDAVAAVGTSSYFLWLAVSLAIICKIGGNVKVSQSIGAHDMKSAQKYVSHTMVLNVAIALMYMFVLMVFNKQLVGFFNLGDANIEFMARTYLVIVAVSMVFFFFNPVISAILTAFGNSKVPFYINSVGLVVNIILDPLMILGYGPFPEMGVAGAAIATAISQVVVSSIFIAYIYRSVKIKNQLEVFHHFTFRCTDIGVYKEIIKIGLPASVQSAFMAILSMMIAKIVALWGPVAIAAQKVGNQLESISWMTCEGFSVAISTVIGQNYGAKNYDRIKKSFFVSIVMVATVGAFANYLFFFHGETLFRLFLDEPEAVAIGTSYLKILSISQIFMCFEIATSGAFNGISKPTIPAVIVTLFTALRIPLAMALASTALGLNGIWTSITVTSMMKGALLLTIFLIYMRKKIKPLFKPVENAVPARSVFGA